MILAVDIGNTGVTLGLGDQDRIVRMDRCGTHENECAAFLKGFIGNVPLDGAVVGSVVPRREEAWRQAVKTVCGLDPLFIDCHLNLGIDIDYPVPEQIGADRLANAAGAYARFGAPVVVADFGTALTFDVISSEAAYVGGVIAPGLSLMFDYLSEKTALLPHVEPKSSDHSVGKSTVEAMQIGARRGYCGMVHGILSGIRSELGEFAFCATGGYAGWVLKECGDKVEVVPDLTLQGLVGIYALNREEGNTI